MAQVCGSSLEITSVPAAEILKSFNMAAVDKEMEAELREKFSMLDANGDGVLDKQELMDMFVPLGDMLGVNEWGLLFNEMDKDGDGTVSINEFLNFVLEVRESVEDEDKMDALSKRVKAKLPKGVTDAEVRKAAKTAFDAVDKKRTGSITKKDALVCMKKFVVDIGLPALSEKEADEALKILDKNGDARLCFNEFQPFIRDCLEMKAES